MEREIDQSTYWSINQQKKQIYMPDIVLSSLHKLKPYILSMIILLLQMKKLKNRGSPYLSDSSPLGFY